MLDNLLALLQKNPRLQSTDYFELVQNLQKIVAKDSNVNIVMVAAKCITGIASGIRKEFKQYASMCLTPLLERTKEKKQHIVDALREACDAIWPSTTYESIAELTTATLAHKTPIVRTQTALFLARCFAMATTTTLPKKVLKMYLPSLIKNLSEADATVRESSSEALGALLKSLGEKIFLPNIVDVEQLKQDKIKEYAEKCVLLTMKGEPRGGQAAAPVAAETNDKATSAPTRPGAPTKAPPGLTKLGVPKPGVPKPGVSKPSGSKPGVSKPSGSKPGPSKAEEVKKGPAEETDLHVSTIVPCVSV